MLRDTLRVVADTSSPALERLKELSAKRKRAEKAYRAAYEAEREEMIRLLRSDEAGAVAIADVMGMTREAVRQAHNAWKRAHGVA